MSWSAKFDEPIALPGGKKLSTLRQAAEYITKLSKADRDATEWQTAMHVLLQAADNGGPVSFARIGMMQALNRHEVRVYNTDRKDPKWSKKHKLIGSDNLRH